MSLPKLGISLMGPSGRGAVVTLDGHNIAAGLTELNVRIHPDEVTTARLTISVDGVDLDAETLLILQAHVDAQKPEEVTAP